MKPGKVISLEDYRAGRREAGRAHAAAGCKALPGSANLWELLDRNISLKSWEKGI